MSPPPDQTVPSVADITVFLTLPWACQPITNHLGYVTVTLQWVAMTQRRSGIKALSSGLFLHPMLAFIPQQSHWCPHNACVSSPSTPLHTLSLTQDANLPSPESFPLPRWLYAGR